MVIKIRHLHEICGYSFAEREEYVCANRDTRHYSPLDDLQGFWIMDNIREVNTEVLKRFHRRHGCRVNPKRAISGPEINARELFLYRAQHQKYLLLPAPSQI